MDDLERLERNIDTALAVLSPKFNITGVELQSFEKPSIELGNPTRFEYKGRKIIIQPQHIDIEQLVGEEVSHYLHGELSPQIMTGENLDRFEILARKKIIECVGHYGALIYLNYLGVQYKPKKWSIDEHAAAEDFIDSIGHEDGYRRANRLFELYGETKLPELARMNCAEASHTLIKLAPLDFYERRILPVLQKFGW